MTKRPTATAVRPANGFIPARDNPHRQSTEYLARKGVCGACALRSQCTASPHGRAIARHREHELVLRARTQATSAEAWCDYRRRRHLMEGSFAQAANLHHFKKARWRRLWRQQIQDWLIAACQNIKLLLRYARPELPVAGTQFRPTTFAAFWSATRRIIHSRCLIGRASLQFAFA